MIYTVTTKFSAHEKNYQLMSIIIMGVRACINHTYLMHLHILGNLNMGTYWSKQIIAGSWAKHLGEGVGDYHIHIRSN